MPDNPHSHLKSILGSRPKGTKWKYPDQSEPFAMNFGAPYEEGIDHGEYATLMLELLAVYSIEMQLFDQHKWSVEKQDGQLNIVFAADRVPLNFTNVDIWVQYVVRMALVVASAVAFVRNQNSEQFPEERDDP